MKWMEKFRWKKDAGRELEPRVEEPPESRARGEPETSASTAEQIKTLTPREREVLFLLVQGKKMREAAEILGVKQTTISFHSTSLYKKLKVQNRAQLILRYGFPEYVKSGAEEPQRGERE